jgi:Fur family zinc uptake transcriptional regulator
MISAASHSGSQLSHAREICAAAGERLTPVREAVFDLLLQAEAPVTAYTLLDRLKAARGGATPPTIYRALNFLVEIGLAHRIERLNAFVACAGAAHHTHPAEFLICSQCGSVVELKDPNIGAAIGKAAADLAFRPARITVEVEGVCGGCAGAN